MLVIEGLIKGENRLRWIRSINSLDGSLVSFSTIVTSSGDGNLLTDLPIDSLGKSDLDGSFSNRGI